MRVLIIDDERLARAELRRLLAGNLAIEILGEAANADDAVDAIDRVSPDLVFLDVEMPGGTGFDVLSRVERLPLVIFTTAYDAHAVRAFEINALDYLLKPVEERRLAHAIERAERHLASHHEASAPTQVSYLERTFIQDGALCLMVDFRDVMLFESEGNYTRLYLERHQPLLGRSLTYLEERLDPRRFFRANRRELVNLETVARIEPSGALMVLHLKNGRTVEMSRRQAQRFRQLHRA